MRFRFSSNRASSLPNGSLTGGVDKFRIRPEELLQRLRVLARNHTNRVRSLVVFLASPEELPEMGQVVERVRINPLLHSLGHCSSVMGT